MGAIAEILPARKMTTFDYDRALEQLDELRTEKRALTSKLESSHTQNLTASVEFYKYLISDKNEEIKAQIALIAAIPHVPGRHSSFTH